MMPVVLSLFVLMGAAKNAWAQTVIEPTVFAEEHKGSGPGEFAISAVSFSAPRIAVDDKENVYVLDLYNNRVHLYNGDGRFVRDIPLQAMIRPTAAERKKAPLLPSAVPSISEFQVVDGVLYAAYRHGSTFNHLLKLQGDAFVEFDTDPGAQEIRKKISPQYRRRHELAHMEEEQKRIGLAPAVLAKASYVQLLSSDKFKNAWVIDSDLRVYSPAGELLSERKLGSFSVVLSKRGNLYISILFSKKLGWLTNFDTLNSDDVDGVRIMKFALQGK